MCIYLKISIVLMEKLSPLISSTNTDSLLSVLEFEIFRLLMDRLRWYFEKQNSHFYLPDGTRIIAKGATK